MDVFDIIAKKEYLELTDSELQAVGEVCESEEDFFQMKQVLAEVNAMTQTTSPQPAKETKERLDALFAAQSFPKTAPVWYNGVLTALYPRDKHFFRRPVVQAAAIALLFFSIFPLMWNNAGVLEKDQLAVNDQKEEVQQPEIQYTENAKEESSEEAPVFNTQTVDSGTASETKTEQLFDRSVRSKTSETGKDETSGKVLNGFMNDQDEFSGVKEVSSAAFAETASATRMVHPDGVFDLNRLRKESGYSVPASEKPAVLDLLTATF